MDQQSMDARLKALAQQELKGHRVKESKFPTQIIELPSKGLLYEEGNPLRSGKLEIKYITTQEQDIMTTDRFIEDGSAVDRMLSNLIISNGEGMPVLYDDLKLGDKNFLMLKSRIMSYGSTYTFQFPINGEQEWIRIDLNEIDINYLDESTMIDTNRWKFNIEEIDTEIIFKALSSAEEQKLRGKSKKRKSGQEQKYKNRDTPDNKITGILKSIIVSFGDEDDPRQISELVKDLPAMVSQKLFKYANKVVPDISLDMYLEEFDRNITVPITKEFFFPAD